MILGRIVGTVVATLKDDKLTGAKLLVVQTTDVRGKADGGYVVAGFTDISESDSSPSFTGLPTPPRESG